MKIHIEAINSVTKKITVSFDEKACEEIRSSVLKKVQAQVELPGFRKGKVPCEILKRRYSDALLEEFRRELLSKTLEHLDKKEKLEITALLKTDFSDLDKGQSLVLEAEISPEIELPDYKKFQVETAKIEVSEGEIQDFIERLRKQQATYEVVDRPVQAKDYVKLSYEGTVEGKPVDDYEGIPHLWGKQKTTWEEADAADGLGIPEIVAGLKGLKAGESREISVHFPKTFAVVALQNKDAVYKVSVLEVREVKLPALEEAFFKGLHVKDLEDLKTVAQKTIYGQKEQEFANQQKQRISEFFIQSVQCELPSTWVKKETERILQEMVNLFSSHGIKNTMLEEQKNALFEKAQKIAKDRIRLNLCFEKIFKDEKLKMDSRDIERVLIQEAAQRHITPEKMLQLVQKDEELRNDIQSKAFQAKMINWLYDTLRHKEESAAK